MSRLLVSLGGVGWSFWFRPDKTLVTTVSRFDFWNFALLSPKWFRFCVHKRLESIPNIRSVAVFPEREKPRRLNTPNLLFFGVNTKAWGQNPFLAFVFQTSWFNHTAFIREDEKLFSQKQKGLADTHRNEGPPTFPHHIPNKYRRLKLEEVSEEWTHIAFFESQPNQRCKTDKTSNRRNNKPLSNCDPIKIVRDGGLKLLRLK